MSNPERDETRPDTSSRRGFLSSLGALLVARGARPSRAFAQGGAGERAAKSGSRWSLEALTLGALVGLNAAVAVARVRIAPAGGGRASIKSLLASAPGLLTGFTCCVPTAVLALGSLAAGLTVAVVVARPYLVPAAALALAANLVWGARRRGRLLGESQSGPVSDLRP
jgi:hypothetical protein